MLITWGIHGVSVPVTLRGLFWSNWVKNNPLISDDIPLDSHWYPIFSLVGGIPTPLKNLKVSWDFYSQYMEKCSKPPTSSYMFIYMFICYHIFLMYESSWFFLGTSPFLMLQTPVKHVMEGSSTHGSTCDGERCKLSKF